MAKEVREIEDDDDDYEDDDYEDDKPRRGMSKATKIIAIVIVIFIVIAALFAFFANPTVKSIYLNPPVEDINDNGIDVRCNVALEGSGNADGDGTIEIFYKDAKVYSSSIEIKRSVGEKNIPYEQFVIGNSNYTLKVTYNGQSGSIIFKLYDFDWAVSENINVTASLSTYEKSDTVTLKLLGRIVDKKNKNIAPPKKVDVEISIKHEDGQQQTFEGTIEYPKLTIEFTSYNYLTTNSGNYTINANLINYFVKDSSDYKEVEMEEPVQTFFNINVDGEISGDSTATLPPRGTGNANFDGSNSWNDGEIKYYFWDFDYKDENNDDYETPDFTQDASGVKVNHTYTALGTYIVALRVIGGFAGILDGEVIYEEDIETFEIDVRLI